MKNTQKFLNILLLAVAVAFLMASAWRCIRYLADPLAFSMNSAPWYLPIELNAIGAAILIGVILLIKKICKAKH